MRKRVLYISRSYVDDSPVGIRFNNFRKYLNKTSDLTVLNLTSNLFIYKKHNFPLNVVVKLLKKLPWVPDIDVLIINRYKREITKLLKNNSFDTVIIGVLPFSFLLLVKHIKKRNPAINIIVDMTDHITVNQSFKSYCKFKREYFTSLETKSLKLVDLLIVLNFSLKEYYKNKFNLQNVIVIEQGIEKNVINNQLSTLRDIKKEFTYVGHLYEGMREPFELYNAVFKLGKVIKLNMYGGFKKKFHPPKKDCFYYGGNVRRVALNGVYDEADVIVFIDNKNSLQVPGKILEVLALNKPILFIYYNTDSPTLKYIESFEGVYISKNKKEEITSTINDILQLKNVQFKRNLNKYFWSNLLFKINPYI